MIEQELKDLVALCTQKKTELKLSNVIIADMCRFSTSSVDRFFRGDMKRPTWEFVRILAQILDIHTQAIHEVAPHMRESFRGDPLPPPDREHVASSQDLNDLVDVYRALAKQKEDTFVHALNALEDDFASAMEELREQHKQEIARLTRITRNLFISCCILVFVLVVVLCIF
jgi:hypothetical protein